MKHFLFLAFFMPAFAAFTQIVNIPDPIFKNALINHNPRIDVNYDYEIDATEALAVDSIIVNNIGMSDLTGLEAFTNLIALFCSNNNISQIDLTMLSKLVEIIITNNQLTTFIPLTTVNYRSVDISGNQITTLNLDNCNIQGINASNNQLTSLSLINAILDQVSFSNNQLTSLDLTNCTAGFMSLSNNLFSSLDFSTMQYLAYLDANNNLLSQIIFPSNPKITDLFISNNQLTSLDLSGHPSLYSLFLDNNQLQFLDLRNGKNTQINPINLSGNPNLTCVAVDDPAYSAANWTNVDAQTQFSLNCGCGALDAVVDSIKPVDCSSNGYLAVHGTGWGAPFQYTWLNAQLAQDSILIADKSGFYTLQLTNAGGCSGEKTFYMYGPKVFNGMDLSINLNAGGFRPGRNTQVNLSARNDGCQASGAQVNLTFTGPGKFVSSSIPPDVQGANNMQWNAGSINDMNGFFSQLAFAVDSSAQLGDRICFDISVTPVTGDVIPLNNTKTYCFDVVNSYDPNDKQVYPQGLCNEHLTIKDQPLIYTIRFQNTGNAPAIDIYLLDSLSSNLNINTVRLLESSHQPVILTKIGNHTLRFDYKDINLADSLSDEAASQGYVTFEVSPFMALPDGTVIDNTTGIYFDLNPPVITNTTTNTLVSVLPQLSVDTVIGVLAPDYVFMGQTYTEPGIYHVYAYTNGTCDSLLVLMLSSGSTGSVDDLQASSAMLLYPNPTKGVFHLVLNEIESGASIQIIDAQGRSVRELEVVDQNSIDFDLTDVQNGLYFVQILQPDQRISSLKLIKE